VHNEHSGRKEGPPLQISWTYDPEQESEGVPWGPHKFPFILELDEMTLAVEKNSKEGFIYRRIKEEEALEKSVLIDNGHLTVCPVEPVHIPARISISLLIELNFPVVIEPRAARQVLLTFPIDIASVIKRGKNEGNIIDVFTFNRVKYSLYGNINDGVICRYWQSGVYADVPAINPLEQGVMKLEIQNPGNRWTEVNKAVFSAFGMKIYYSPRLVSMNAVMKISSDVTAETGFLDKPLKAGMKKVPVERYGAKLLGQQGRTVMEEGY